MCFHIGDVCGNDFRSLAWCICVCVSSCGYTGVSDAARSYGRGLGLVNPCTRLPAPHLRALWFLARAFGPLAHPRALDCQALQDRAVCGSACSMGCHFGWTIGQSLWGKECLLFGSRVVRAHGLLTSASHSLKTCLQVLHARCQHFITVTLCSNLPSLGSEETGGVYPSPTPQSWAWGL